MWSDNQAHFCRGEKDMDSEYGTKRSQPRVKPRRSRSLFAILAASFGGHAVLRSRSIIFSKPSFGSGLPVSLRITSRGFGRERVTCAMNPFLARGKRGDFDREWERLAPSDPQISVQLLPVALTSRIPNQPNPQNRKYFNYTYIEKSRWEKSTWQILFCNSKSKS